MTWKNVKIREELYDRVAALAGRGSVSSMFEEIVLAYFKQAGEVEDPMVATTDEIRQGRDIGASSSTSSPLTDDDPTVTETISIPGSRGKRQRKSTCEHRIPPGSYCRVCDG
jgi:hypothetical protein